MQLAAVTALMDDIDPHNQLSPPIIHVVSYSEALHLATPKVIDESVQITHHSLQKYRQLRKMGRIEDMSENIDVKERMNELIHSAKVLISAIERIIPNPYSPEGFYLIFAAGFLPVPYLWGEVEEFKYAKGLKTRLVKGSVKLVDDEEKIVKANHLVDYASLNLAEAKYNLQNRIAGQ